VLSIGKLGAGNEHYYLSTVAGGVEDYYLGRGEAPGHWIGAGAEDLDLEGEVDGERLAAVLDGRDPLHGVRLVRGRSDRVPGFDLTFRAPKSVSVLFGLAEHDIVREVRAAHDVAVDAALGFLEREACGTRRGTDGVDAVDGSGFVGAAFRHRTSRAGDPHLHTHVVVANLTRTPDDRYGALDARRLYLFAKTAGYLYEAQLRGELTRRLGVEWGPVRNGIADLVGIPEPVLRGFSTRRAEIEEEMARRGVTSARAAEIAALDTRQAKDYQVDPVTLRERWWDQAERLGLTPDTLAQVSGLIPPLGAGQRDVDREVRREVSRDVEREVSREVEREVARIVHGLVGPDGLTARASTFDRRDVLRAWCDRLKDGADVTAIETFADRTLAAPAVVKLAAGRSTRLRRRSTGRRIEGPALGARYSTVELMTLEQRLVDQALARRDRHVGVVDESTVLAALGRRPELSGEQVELVVALTTGGDGIDVVIAPAGTGKTFALDAARDAWQSAGYRVIGATLAARAAVELQATAGISAQTIASLLVDLDHPVHGGFPARCVVVIDEAGMVGTRTLARLLDHAARADAKVVLVGDHRQLPEIDAGGLLRGLGERLDALRLTTNRRQHEPWERAALAKLRDGQIDTALADYQTHGRLVTTPTATTTREVMVGDWWAARLAGQQTLMVASRWFDVDDLNARARHLVFTHGLLSGPILEVAGRSYQAGDEIMTLRNQRRLGVRNGTIATITALDADTRTLTIRDARGNSATLPGEYLDAGHVRHAYATTIHKAQGLTVDQAFVLGDDALYQEAGYVALSRGRTQNRLYLVGRPHDAEHHAPPAPRSPLDELAAALRVSRAQELAIAQPGDTCEIRERLVQLYDTRDVLRGELGAAPPDQTANITALQTSQAELRRSLDHQRSQLTALEHQHPIRHRREHAARRLATVRHVDVLATGLDDTTRALDHAVEHQHARTTYLVEHSDAVDQLPTLERHIEEALDGLVDSYEHDPPAYLARLGPFPTTPERRSTWIAGARLIEQHRHEHRINDEQHPFGVLDRTNVHQQLTNIQLEGILKGLEPGLAHDAPNIGVGLS
jgi:conjugative relaxase-like TrwC/TraI family protein